MSVAGIIVEYNPLHKGHLYHLSKVRELTGCRLIVAVMSGNFVQRGQFAIIDKWTRAQAAIEAGVNLVIELPFPFVCQSASQFGKSAVELLSLAKADAVVFGSETNNIEELQEIADMSFNIDNFKENMKQGYSYPASYGYLADSYGPNDILAISYLRALKAHPDIKGYSIKRTSGYHDESINEEYPSARAIRAALAANQDISLLSPLAEKLKDYPSPSWDRFYPYVRTLLMTSPKDELRQIFLMDEGIENHLVKQAAQSADYGEFINKATTRRYTTSRIQRTLCQLLVHNRKQDMVVLPPIDRIRPLAYDQLGQKHLKQLQQAGLIVANHFTQNVKQYRELEYRAAAVYGMLMDEKHRHQVIRAEIVGQFLKRH